MMDIIKDSDGDEKKNYWQFCETLISKAEKLNKSHSSRFEEEKKIIKPKIPAV